MDERFETFTVLINRINRNIRKIKNEEMAVYKLRSVHISCLYYLYTKEGLIAADLCGKCAEDKATISRAVEYLEANGYLTCETKESKRYKSPLFLTQKGKEAGKRIADKINEVLARISSTMTEAERVDFYRKLTSVSESLEAVAKTYE